MSFKLFTGAQGISLLQVPLISAQRNTALFSTSKSR
uniref:Uncharacterized protein n=1 Tax=Anguilla anguilla TaxID=7936 RepID=A0A0E9W8H1_ANGAN